MYDLICFGGISMDFYFKGNSLTFHDDRFQLAIGGKYMVDVFSESLGGGAANVAIGARKNGLKTAVLGKIGNNVFKRIILQKFAEQDISYSLCEYSDDYSNISMILLAPNGERSIVHYMSPHQHIISDSNDLKGITKTKMVFMGNLPDISLTERIELLGFFKKKSIKTVLNLGVKDCRRPVSQLDNLLKNADIVILNGHEFSEMVKAPYKDIHFKEHVVKWYIPHLSQTVVIITEGEKGSYGYYQDDVFFQKSVPIEHITDATGAGDAYTAAFISEYFKTADIQKSMDKGAQYATKILAKIGAN